VNKAAKKRIYRGRILDLNIERHKLPNGRTVEYEIVRHVPAAAVVPVRKNQVLLIRQYRVPIARYIWEIPAGLIEKNETPLRCIKREMIEETGFKGKNFKKLGVIYTSAGFCDEKITLYRCDVGEHIGTNHDNGEIITVHWFSKSEVKKMIAGGKINDVKTLSALAYLISHRTL